MEKIFVFILFVSVFISCSFDKTTLQINGHTFYIELAQTFDQRAKGLMNRSSMPVDDGMLFVFEKEQKLGFWMKNTKIPLSIAYINKMGEIKEIYDMEPYSEKSIPSIYSCMYALELNQGRFEELGIEPGDFVEIDFDSFK